MASSSRRLELAGLFGAALCLAVGGYANGQPRTPAAPQTPVRGSNPYQNVGVNPMGGGFNPTGMTGQLYSNVPSTGTQDGLSQASATINSPRGLIPGLLTQPDPLTYGYGNGGYGGFGGFGATPYGAIFAGTPFGGYGGFGNPGFFPPFQPPANTPNAGYSFGQEYTNFTQDHSGYLRGMADVMNASGNLQIQSQQARLIGQQYQLGKIALRRAMWDQWAYERANMPTLQQFLAESKANKLARTLIAAPITEIIAGDSLNTLIQDLKEKGDSGQRGNAIPIDEDILRHINVTTPRGGSLGALRPLRDGGSLEWPFSLETDYFKDDLKRINGLAKEAVARIEQPNGRVDAGTYNNLNDAVTQLDNKVTQNKNGMPPNQWIDAKESIRGLKESLRALEQRDANKFVVKGKTVPELVDYMAKNGLKIAPAVTGDEAAYKALYEYLTSYRSTLSSAAAPTNP